MFNNPDYLYSREIKNDLFKKDNADDLNAFHNDISNKFNDNAVVLNHNPNPIDREINLDPSKTIMSKTDARGIIEYANDYFMEVSGYDEFELMGQPHNIVRHPDMPKGIFKEMWKRLNKGENIHAFVKNLAKDGRYYWVLTNFETKFDQEGNIVSHYARRKAIPGNAIYSIEKLYKTLKSIEDTQSIDVANKYFNGLLEEMNTTYNDYILDVLGMNKKELDNYFKLPAKSKKRGITSLFKK